MFVVVLSILAAIARTWASSSSNCTHDTLVWTYYPCSFLVSWSIDECQPSLRRHLSVDRCLNEDMLVFWHFPLGNLTLTFVSNVVSSFSLRLFTRSLFQHRSIRHVYQLFDNQTFERRLFKPNRDETVTLQSDAFNQCSIKLETMTSIIVDYGLFIRMTIIPSTYEHD
jgi:hypothetical protein